MMAESTDKLAGDSTQPTGISNIYKYSPLTNPEDIRLMELLPGDKSAPLVCRLSVLALSDAPQYEALSYTWGDLSDRQNLCLEPEDPITINASTILLKITRSLYEALMELRDPADSRMMWVDAVCIDQGNLLERGHQVKIMRKIYNQAKRVLIWLGPEDRSTPQTVAMVAEFKNLVVSKGLSLESLRTLKAPRLLSELLDFRNTFDWGTSASFWTLYNRPWFKRMWVIQEATAGGSDSYCHIGSYVIPWDDLGVTTLWLETSLQNTHYPWRTNSGRRNALFMWHSRLLTSRTPPPLLHEARRFSATDARDKVHALFGFPSLQRLSEEFGFTPDYTISVQKVYESVTMMTINSSQTLEILHYVDHAVEIDDNDLTWPSWIPRWDKETAYRRFPLQDYTLDNKTPQGILSVAGDYREGILDVKGRSIGYVRHITNGLKLTGITGVDTMTDSLRFLEQFWNDVLQELLKQFRVNNLEHPREKDWVDYKHQQFKDLARALTAGSDLDFDASSETGVVHTYDAIEFFLHYFEVRPSPSLYYSPLREDLMAMRSIHIAGDMRRYEERLSWSCNNRRLFFTNTGYFGLCPRATRLGDVIAILYGGYAPFVLRPSGDEFLLIGECYVTNMMEANALELLMQKSETSESEERIFRLK